MIPLLTGHNWGMKRLSNLLGLKPRFSDLRAHSFNHFRTKCAYFLGLGSSVSRACSCVMLFYQEAQPLIAGAGEREGRRTGCRWNWPPLTALDCRTLALTCHINCISAWSGQGKSVSLCLTLCWWNQQGIPGLAASGVCMSRWATVSLHLKSDCAEREDLKGSARGLIHRPWDWIPKRSKSQKSHGIHQALKTIGCCGRTIPALPQDLEGYRAVCTHTDINRSHVAIKHVISPNPLQLWKQLRHHPPLEALPNSPMITYKNKQTNRKHQITRFPAGSRKTSLIENNVNWLVFEKSHSKLGNQI